MYSNLFSVSRRGRGNFRKKNLQTEMINMNRELNLSWGSQMISKKHTNHVAGLIVAALILRSGQQPAKMQPAKIN